MCIRDRRCTTLRRAPRADASARCIMSFARAVRRRADVVLGVAYHQTKELLASCGTEKDRTIRIWRWGTPLDAVLPPAANAQAPGLAAGAEVPGPAALPAGAAAAANGAAPGAQPVEAAKPHVAPPAVQAEGPPSRGLAVPDPAGASSGTAAAPAADGGSALLG